MFPHDNKDTFSLTYTKVIVSLITHKHTPFKASITSKFLETHLNFLFFFHSFSCMHCYYFYHLIFFHYYSCSVKCSVCLFVRPNSTKNVEIFTLDIFCGYQSLNPESLFCMCISFQVVFVTLSRYSKYMLVVLYFFN
jgi:hypothetical protein